MEWDLDQSLWPFSQCHHNGTEIFGDNLPNFRHQFQQYIDDKHIPGKHGGQNF
jgi:hypothetical protein